MIDTLAETYPCVHKMCDQIKYRATLNGIIAEIIQLDSNTMIYML